MTTRDVSDIKDDPLIAEVLKRLPSKLYKYSGLSGSRRDWMQDLVLRSRLYLPVASQFNDPLDCRIPPTFDAPELTIRRYWRAAVRKDFPGTPMRDHKRRIDRMVRGFKTPRGQTQLTETIFESLDEHGIACFARDPANMLMWSYYAEGHTGIAVRFNTDALRDLKAYWLPIDVRYETNFPEYNFYRGQTTAEFLMTILGTKSTAWAHEQEWRIVVPNERGILKLPEQAVDGVVMGLRTDSKTEDEIRGWVKQRPSLDLMRVVHKPRSFELEIEPA